MSTDPIKPDPIKVAHFRNLISLIAADGRIQEIEKVTLSKIAYEQGIPLERLNVMLLKADEYKYLIPQNLEEREQQLEQMIAVAQVDGDFSAAEMELITMVAGKLGFSRQELDRIINENKK